jgi:hypothetical protein
MIHVVTYATHNFGNFNNLINNIYGINIKVLGWDTNWNGFMDKLSEMYEFISKLSDDDIIIFLDGFDVWINANLEKAINIFKSKNYQVLFSKELVWKPKVLGKYIHKKLFPSTCCNNTVINTGLYMGYAKYLKLILEKALQTDEKDDQRIINKICCEFDFIQIDTNNEIFENVKYERNIYRSKAVFVQVPGNLNIERYIRSMYEYTPYFKYEILLLLISLVIIYQIYTKQTSIFNMIEELSPLGHLHGLSNLLTI